MKKWLLVMLSLLCTSAFAEEQRFVMEPAHCKVLRLHALKAITGKQTGVVYPQYVRERVEDSQSLVAGERLIYMDILPYSLEMAYEYYHNDFNDSTPYEEVIYDNCMKRVGDVAQ
ncbi:hypothetical protein PA10_00277 [Pseudomonas phage pPa_SNUABM_DT01]|nr:hypothetical protein PA10_00277 [Pseudomonas phage pPa_SNUABM_DT01]